MKEFNDDVVLAAMMLLKDMGIERSDFDDKQTAWKKINSIANAIEHDEVNALKIRTCAHCAWEEKMTYEYPCHSCVRNPKYCDKFQPCEEYTEENML